MRRRILLLVPALALAMALAIPTPGVAATNTRVTTDGTAGSYLRYDGSSDATMAACSTGLRAQNEPTVAVDPHSTNVVVSGANDYCAAIVNGDVWSGYYRSTDGGGTWQDSLVPGYPADTSAGGTASPAHGTCGASGDPSQSFDNTGRLFYAFICFNRSKPVNGGVFVARYLSDGASYDRTVLVKKGTPSGQFLTGLFQDKINLVTDQTSGSTSGNVYVAWSQYNGFAPKNAVLFSRSTDHGVTFSAPIRVTPVSSGASFADLAVGPDGDVYLTFITYPSHSNPNAAIWLSRSTNGGQSFGAPSLVSNIDLFDSSQFSGNGSSDCGDAPFDCPTGLTFSRFTSNSAVAADADGVHVVWAARVAAGGQAQVFVRNSPDGVHFSDPAALLDPQATGHQWTPDIASDGGTISVVFYDSRDDSAYSASLPPGDTAGGANSGDVVRAVLAQSTDGGGTWSETTLSTHDSNFNWETHGGRRIGFWGDYIYISSVGGAIQSVWTDSRDLVPGTDARDPTATDGFDVANTCGTLDPVPASNSCLSVGGLDQNIYTARV